MHTDATDEEQEEDIRRVILAALLTMVLSGAHLEDPVPENTSILTGHLYFLETMANPNENNVLHVT